jgi:hypothetical protein
MVSRDPDLPCRSAFQQGPLKAAQPRQGGYALAQCVTRQVSASGNNTFALWVRWRTTGAIPSLRSSQSAGLWRVP